MTDPLQLNRFPLFVIAGPCVIESADVCLTIGRHVKSVCDKLGLDYVSCSPRRVPTARLAAGQAILGEARSSSA